MTLLRVVLLLCILAFCSAFHDLVFGQSCALTGESAELGINLMEGIQAAFAEVNETGVMGYRPVLYTLDDYYEPIPALNNTQRFIEEDVFAFLGLVGTPGAQLVKPIAVEKRIPLIAPLSGAMFLRSPYERYIVNFRASYYDEIAAMVHYCRNTLKKSLFSIFYQNDSFGKEGRDGLILALRSVGTTIHSEGMYERNSMEIEAGLASIANVEKLPEVIVLIGTYNQLAKFVLEAKKIFPASTVYIALSFTGPEFFHKGLDGNIENVYITSVVPPATHMSRREVQKYHSAMSKLFPNGYNSSFLSLEGYLVGSFVIQALKRVDDDVNRESFLDAIFKSGVFEIGDLRFGPYGPNCTRIETGCQCNQGMRTVYTCKLIPEGRFEMVEEFEYSTCGYQFLPYKPPPNYWLLLLLIPVLFVIILLVVVGFIALKIWIRYIKQRKILAGIPSKGEITIVFTDVQESTRLWDALGNVMKESLAIHNEVLRKYIRECNGYEVKTQGDSFMISFFNAVDAVKYCMLVQENLMLADWPELLLNHECAKEVYSSATNLLLFRGLRVRMGVHVGIPDFQWDKVTNRMDYFGGMVNRTARIEQKAQGGQILISKAVYDAIQPHLEELGNPVIEDFGIHELKGLEEPEHLMQVLPRSLQEREFAHISQISGKRKPVFASMLGEDSSSDLTNVQTKQLELTQQKKRSTSDCLAAVKPKASAAKYLYDPVPQSA